MVLCHMSTHVSICMSTHMLIQTQIEAEQHAAKCDELMQQVLQPLLCVRACVYPLMRVPWPFRGRWVSLRSLGRAAAMSVFGLAMSQMSLSE